MKAAHVQRNRSPSLFSTYSAVSPSPQQIRSHLPTPSARQECCLSLRRFQPPTLRSRDGAFSYVELECREVEAACLDRRVNQASCYYGRIFICFKSDRSAHLLAIMRRDLVHWPFVKIPRRCADLTSSLIGILIFSLPILAARPRRGEKNSSTIRRTSASTSASWMPQKSTSCLVLWS